MLIRIHTVLDPLKVKYFDLYWDIAYAAARQSLADRRKVGAAVVTPSGMISIGWNGMPAGFTNQCEVNNKTKPEVIHAERNAIDKMTRQGVSTYGSILFVTTSPCFECAKAIHGLGLKAVYYDEFYHCTSGIDLLKLSGVPTFQKDEK